MSIIYFHKNLFNFVVQIIIVVFYNNFYQYNLINLTNYFLVDKELVYLMYWPKKMYINGKKSITKPQIYAKEYFYILKIKS